MLRQSLLKTAPSATAAATTAAVFSRLQQPHPPADLDLLAEAAALSSDDADEKALELLRARPARGTRDRALLDRDLALLHAAFAQKQVLCALRDSSMAQPPLEGARRPHEWRLRMMSMALERAKDHLLNVGPRTLRLEVLENIYSFIFLTRHDLGQEAAAGEDAVGEDAVSGEEAEGAQEAGAVEEPAREIDSDERGANSFLARPAFIEETCILLKDHLDLLSSAGVATNATAIGTSAADSVLEEDAQRRSSAGSQTDVRRRTEASIAPFTTVSSGELVARLNQLDSAVSELQWRFNLVKATQRTELGEGAVRGVDVDAGVAADGGAAVQASSLPPSPVPAILAPPTTLLTTCIRSGEFERAQQVIDMFQIDSAVAQDARFGQQLAELASRLSRGLNYAAQLDMLLEQLPTLNAVQACLDLASTSALRRDACQALLSRASDLLEVASAPALAHENTSNDAPAADSSGEAQSGPTTPPATAWLTQGLAQVKSLFEGSSSALATVLLRHEAPFDEDSRRVRKLQSDRAMAEDMLVRALRREGDAVDTPGGTREADLVSLESTSTTSATGGNSSGVRSSIATLLSLYAGAEVPTLEARRPLPAFFCQLETILASLFAHDSGAQADSHALAMLDEAPTATLVRILLELHVPVAQAEELANRLGLDLQLVLQRASCNRVPLRRQQDSPAAGQAAEAALGPSAGHVTDTLVGPVHVLNLSQTQEGDGPGPAPQGAALEDTAPVEPLVAGEQGEIARRGAAVQNGIAPACNLTHRLLSKLCSALAAAAAQLPPKTRQAAASLDAGLVVLTPASIAGLLATPAVRRALDATQALAEVNFALLSETERTCALANVFNLLRLHACLTIGPPAGAAGRRVWESRVAYRLGSIGTVTLADLARTLMPPTPSTKIAAAVAVSDASEDIAHAVAASSLDALLAPPHRLSPDGAVRSEAAHFSGDEEADMLLGGLAEGAAASQLGARGETSGADAAALAAVRIESPEANLIFALWDGTASSPAPAPLLPATMQSTLRNARTQHLLRTVDARPAQECVRLPWMLLYHAKRLGLAPNAADGTSVALAGAVLQFCSDHLPAGSRRHSLVRSVNSADIVFEPHRWQPALRLPETSPVDPRHIAAATLSARALDECFFPPSPGPAPVGLSPEAEEYLRMRDAPGYSLAMMLSAAIPGTVAAAGAQPQPPSTGSSVAGHPFEAYQDHVRATINVSSLHRLVESRLQPLLNVSASCGQDMPLPHLQALLFHDDASPLRWYASHRLLDELINSGQPGLAADLILSGALPLKRAPDGLLVAAALAATNEPRQRRLAMLVQDKLLCARLVAALVARHSVDSALAMAKYSARNLQEALAARSNGDGGEVEGHAELNDGPFIATPSLFIRAARAAERLLRRLRIYAKMLLINSEWRSWPEVARLTRDAPEEAMLQLVRRRAYALSREWAEAHDIVDRSIDTHYIAMLLRDEDLHRAHETLEAMDSKVATSIVWELVAVATGLEGASGAAPAASSSFRPVGAAVGAKMGAKTPALGASGRLEEGSTSLPLVTTLNGLHFLLRHLLDQPSGTLSQTRRVQLQKAELGVAMLMRLPPTLLPQCQPLVAYPSRILEQLLMIREVGAAALALEALPTAALDDVLALDGESQLTPEDRGELPEPLRSRSASRFSRSSAGRNSGRTTPAQEGGQPQDRDATAMSTPAPAPAPMPTTATATADSPGASSTAAINEGGRRSGRTLANVMGLPAQGGAHGGVLGKASRRGPMDLIAFYARRALRFPPRPRNASIASSAEESQSSANLAEYVATAHAAHTATEGKSDREGVARLWHVAVGEAEQTLVRSSFTYDGAPSTILCLALVDLYRDPHTCGQLCLALQGARGADDQQHVLERLGHRLGQHLRVWGAHEGLEQLKCPQPEQVEGGQGEQPGQVVQERLG
jgi:hypothetical protein